MLVFSVISGSMAPFRMFLIGGLMATLLTAEGDDLFEGVVSSIVPFALLMFAIVFSSCAETLLKVQAPTARHVGI